MLNKNSKRARAALVARTALVGCALAAVTASGCRSNSPSLRMFGWNREPSAEALAGSGPTTTYPVPPSATASPQAIDSIAAGVSPPQTSPTKSTLPGGGSSGSQIAGLDIELGTKTSSPATNLAAAQANGFYGQAPRTSSATPSPGHPSAGNSSTAGISAAHGLAGSTTASATAPSYAMPSLAGGSSSFTPPGADPAASSPVQKVSNEDSSGGFVLPPGLTSSSPTSSDTAVAGNSTSEPSASEPSASIASSRTGTEPTSPKQSTPNAVSPPSTFAPPSGSYAPGSTSSGSAYPSGSSQPAGGSIYR